MKFGMASPEKRIAKLNEKRKELVQKQLKISEKIVILHGVREAVNHKSNEFVATNGHVESRVIDVKQKAGVVEITAEEVNTDDIKHELKKYGMKEISWNEYEKRKEKEDVMKDL